VTRAATTIFICLVGMTFGAFFLAQRLKNAPAVIQSFTATPVFSPNNDSRKDRAYVAFNVKRPDDVLVTVVDADGDPVDEILSRTTTRNRERVRALWDGRDGDGRRVPDGTYRYRITLRREGRGLVFPKAVRLDTTPPRPRVTSIGVATRTPRPEILPVPGARAATITLRAPGKRLRALVFRTTPRPRLVNVLDVPEPDGPGGRFVRPVKVRWDGTVGRRPVGPGTYVVVAEVRDEAGNVGTSVPLDRNGLPDAAYGAVLPGRGGITVRYAGAEPPPEAVRTGETLRLGVDTRQRRFSWDLRRVGASRTARGERAVDPPADGMLEVQTPGGRSGLYLFTARTASHRTSVPVAVQAAAVQRPVLVVLPVMTWQGRNPQDDDGDGLPNLLSRGDGVRLRRVYAGDGLPATFAGVTAPLMAWLDRTKRRYDITTDVALAHRRGTQLTGHRGVLVAGDLRWLPAGTQLALRSFVAGGGKLATVGVDNLRRQVRLTPRDRLLDPTAAAPFDALGLRPGRLLRGDALTLTNDRDDAGLFEGSSGQLTGFTLAEPLEQVRGGRVVSSAVAGDDNRTVVAAVRTGKGLTIHLGLPQLPSRLGRRADDLDARALMRRTWTLLSR